MHDAPQAPPEPVSAASRLLGLAVLLALGLVGLAVWTRLSARPDTARVDAARTAAAPHIASLFRCLLGAPLAADEHADARLRNVTLAEETRGRTPNWPRRCAVHAEAAREVIDPVRREDARVDRVVAALYSAEIALDRGRAPKGVDALVAAVLAARMNGGSAAANVLAAPAPLRPLRGAEVQRVVIGERRDRFVGLDAQTLWLAGAGLRACRLEAARVVCAPPIAANAQRSWELAATISHGGESVVDASDVDALALARTGEEPAQLVRAAATAPIALGEGVYAALAQQGGALVLRAGAPRAGARTPASIVVESIARDGARREAGTLEVPGTLVRSPQITAGIAYFTHADLRARRPAEARTQQTFGLELAALPASADAPLPAPVSLRIAALPAQVLGCAGPTRRALAQLTDAPRSASAQTPSAPRERSVSVRFFGADGAVQGEVGGSLGGTAAVAHCVGDDLAIVSRALEAVDGRRAARLSGLRCTASSCAASTSTLPTSDVPDVITLRDGRVLAIYRASAAGGLRARVGQLAELGAAREVVLADDTAHGGPDIVRRWLVRDGEGALLVLATRLGHAVVRLDRDVRPTLLNP
jgi:hypothetical protein